MILEKINGPKDIKTLNLEELKKLAEETRNAVAYRVSEIGGHIGPNFGVVELTVALHKVFDSPKDKIVFDVSHQCYAHKVLTGRKDAFLRNEHFSEASGYTNPLESEHDIFTVGHTSTSVSLALGLAKGRDVNNTEENIIAIIGDGSLSGGQALEALNYAGEYNKNLIIIINDNDQSMAENHGGLYQNLKELRESNGNYEPNIFKSFNLDYRYLDDGHDLEKLISLFESVRNINHPIVLHIHTIKGKGFEYAEKNREIWHNGGPFNLEDGSPKSVKPVKRNYIFESLKNLLETNEKAVVVNAGTPMVLGFTKDVRPKYAETERFVDVGIAEENAVAMASGIAKNGGVAVFGTSAPFFQRTYDQMSHDVCLNSSPATMIVLNPGVYGINSNTHIAICDIQMFAHIPNMVYLSPASQEEYERMFEYATTQKNHPTGIRALHRLKSHGVIDDTDYSILNKNKVVFEGEKVALFGVGVLLDMAVEVRNKLKEEHNIEITVINPRFLSGLDEELLEKLKEKHNLVITIEDGELFGGYGQNIASYYGESKMKVKNFGISKEFHTDFNPRILLEENGISVEKLTKYILERI